jgi:hypothetical protein
MIVQHRHNPVSAAASCGHCSFSTNRVDNLVRHIKEVHHLPTAIRCSHCEFVFGKNVSLQNHVRDIHGVAPTAASQPRARTVQAIVPTEHRTSVASFFHSFRIDVNEGDPLQYLVENAERFTLFVNEQTKTLGNIKFQLSIRVKLVKPMDDSTVSPYFNGVAIPLYSNGLDAQDYLFMVDQVISSLSIFCTSGSGWVIDKLLLVDININQHRPIHGSSFIPTPSKLKANRFLLNIVNVEDQCCFIYCALAALSRPSINSSRVTHYQSRLAELSISSEMPMAVSAIPKFEETNDLIVNVFAYDSAEMFPLYISKRATGKTVVNMLLLSENNNLHYCLITNFHAFMNRFTLGKKMRDHHACFYCYRCLQRFNAKDKLGAHVTMCGEHKPTVINMPPEGSNVQYINIQKEEKVPYVVYADFESINRKVSTCAAVPHNPHTRDVERHVPCSFGAVLVKGII